MRLVLTAARERARLDLAVGPRVLRHWFARDLAGHGTSEWLGRPWRATAATTAGSPVTGDV